MRRCLLRAVKGCSVALRRSVLKLDEAGLQAGAATLVRGGGLPSCVSALDSLTQARESRADRPKGPHAVLDIFPPQDRRTAMLKIAIAAVGFAALSLAAAPAFAQGGKKGKDEFLGVDHDTGRTYYDGRNDGKYCLYKTVRRFNRYTGYWENRRVRRCGRGLYM